MFSVLALTIPDNLAKANPGLFLSVPQTPRSTPPIITVQSPAQTKTYNSGEISLNFSVGKSNALFVYNALSNANGSYSIVLVNITSVYYVLDGGEPQKLAVTDTVVNYTNTPPAVLQPKRSFEFLANLNVQEGFHSITVYVEGDSSYVATWSPLNIQKKSMRWSSEPVHFSVLHVRSPVFYSASSSTQDRAVAFIENVLPIDSSKFFIELKSDSVPDKPVFFRNQNISFGGNGDQVLIYFLASRMGTIDWLDVFLAVRNNIVYQFAVDLYTGPNVGQSSLNEAATIFLTRYQNYSGLDSTEMINLLSNVDLTQNASIPLGNLTMAINRTDTSTEVRWVFPDSRAFYVSFQNNFPVSFYDERQILSSTSTPTPTIMQYPTITNGPELSQTEPFPTSFVAAVSVITVVVMVASLLVYQKKHKRSLQNY